MTLDLVLFAKHSLHIVLWVVDCYSTTSNTMFMSSYVGVYRLNKTQNKMVFLTLVAIY